MRKQLLTIVAVAIGAILTLSLLLIYGLPYSNSPEHIRHPAVDHPHYRLQTIVDGQAVNFGESKYQEQKPDVCSEDIPETPIHFHDGLDQFLHIHWKGMTGGEVLKYYGWNFIGGANNSLGARFDTGALPTNVPIHGEVLPSVPTGANFYVYVGDENGYQRKSWNDFLNQDLQTFFGKHSSFAQGASLNWFESLIFKRAAAHGGINDGHETGEMSQEDLQLMNNLIGNMVIFVQPSEPSGEQIKEKFDHLVPLQDSACGG